MLQLKHRVCAGIVAPDAVQVSCTKRPLPLETGRIIRLWGGYLESAAPGKDSCSQKGKRRWDISLGFCVIIFLLLKRCAVRCNHFMAKWLK